MELEDEGGRIGRRWTSRMERESSVVGWIFVIILLVDAFLCVLSGLEVGGNFLEGQCKGIVRKCRILLFYEMDIEGILKYNREMYLSELELG